MGQDDPTDMRFTPYELLKSERRAAGDIILLGSELEHLVSVAFFKTAEIHADIGFKLFGKSSVSSKIQNIRQILKSKNREIYIRFESIFEELDDFQRCRNMFAHGVFMGLQENYLCFLVTADPSLLNEEDVVFKVKRFARNNFMPYILSGQHLDLKLRAIFDISSLREAVPYKLHQKRSRGP